MTVQQKIKIFTPKLYQTLAQAAFIASLVKS